MEATVADRKAGDNNSSGVGYWVKRVLLFYGALIVFLLMVAIHSILRGLMRKETSMEETSIVTTKGNHNNGSYGSDYNGDGRRHDFAAAPFYGVASVGQQRQRPALKPLSAFMWATMQGDMDDMAICTCHAVFLAALCSAGFSGAAWVLVTPLVVAGLSGICYHALVSRVGSKQSESEDDKVVLFG